MDFVPQSKNTVRCTVLMCYLFSSGSSFHKLSSTGRLQTVAFRPALLTNIQHKLSARGDPRKSDLSVKMCNMVSVNPWRKHFVSWLHHLTLILGLTWATNPPHPYHTLLLSLLEERHELYNMLSMHWAASSTSCGHLSYYEVQIISIVLIIISLRCFYYLQRLPPVEPLSLSLSLFLSRSLHLSVLRGYYVICLLAQEGGHCEVLTWNMSAQ